MHIFSSCVLVTALTVLAPGLATPAPIPQDVDVCVDGVDATVDIPIATLDYSFFIKIIPTTAETPSLDLGDIAVGSGFKLALGQNMIRFNLADNNLSAGPDSFVRDKGNEFVISTVFGGVGISTPFSVGSIKAGNLWHVYGPGQGLYS